MTRVAREVAGYKGHGYRVHTASEYDLRVPVLAKDEHSEHVLANAFHWLYEYKKDRKKQYLSLVYMVIRTCYRAQLRYTSTTKLYTVAFDMDGYYDSDEWQGVVRVVKRRDRVCRICARSLRLEVHHNSYDHFGEESGHLGDLTLLCRRCHRAVHRHILPTRRK